MTKLKSAIYGFIIGDCLGVPFEFNKRGNFQCENMVGYKTHNQPAGTWSDDTSLTLATLDSLKEKGYKVDVYDMREKFAAWLYEGKYTVDGTVFDCGCTTHEAIDLEKGLDDFYSNGNGSLMRILPLAFITCTNEEIENVSAITHAHPISKKACTIYVEIIKKLIAGKPLQSILKDIDVIKPFERIKYINTLKEDQINSSGYVVSSLEAALWCVATTTSYKSAVLKAVNLGSDTDTIGALTGGLAGVMYGYENIPNEWIGKIRNKEEIEKYLF